MQRQHFVLVVLAVVFCATGSEACSVLQFHWSGLGAHINGLWSALPALYGSNGSVYLDNTEFPYMCTEGGGWHDYFQTESGFLQPWTPALAKNESCAYYSYGKMAVASDAIGISHVQARFDPAVVRKASSLINSTPVPPSCISRACSGKSLKILYRASQ